jgi:superfamily II RNA helicase
MTTDEFEQLLVQQPVSRLHRLAQGRVHRHFRLGKRRLIEALLQHSTENRAGLESDLALLMRDDVAPKSRPAAPHRKTEASAAPSPFAASRGALTDGERSEPPTDLTAFLAGIGVPPPQPFVADPWQDDALESLKATDVIVSVPTGSGKTYVAVEATRRAIDADRTVIYTSPLKALSNTKFTEFAKIFGRDRVGILTGDRRDNPQAPLLIMTTEILRNLLYDAAGGEIDLRLDTLGLVILDESQYIADPERGVVWEETIIFCPGQARLLLLSASIGNPQDIADWLTSIRPTTCRLVQHHRRSVVPLFRTIGIPKGPNPPLHPEAKRLFAQYEDDSGRTR